MNQKLSHVFSKSSLKPKMEGAKELDLADLFAESDLKMQSSTVYKALRGEGMRVRPLPRTRSSIGKSLTSPAKSESRPGSYMPEKGRVAAIKNIFESQVTENDSTKRYSKVPHGGWNESGGYNQSKKHSAFVRRELTPVSESSNKRVPFRSTILERPVSRASLKEEEADRKPKTLRRAIDTRALQKKSVHLFDANPNVKGATIMEDKTRLSMNIAQNRIQKRKLLKRKRLGVMRRATVVAGKPVITRNEIPKIPPKEESRKTGAGPMGQKVPGVTSKIRQKEQKPGKDLISVPSLPKTPKSRVVRNSIVREVVTKTRVMSPVQPARKQLWLPTDTRDSFNQFSKMPSRTLKRKMPQRGQKKKSITENIVLDDEREKAGTARTQAKSKFDNTTEDESSETDEEEVRMLEELRRRNELKRKSSEFFNQFRYGDKLRKSMPQIRYASEVLAKSEADVKRRMSEIEVRMRLSRLDESVSKIRNFVPKWSGMLLATRDVSKTEQIQKTLTKAERILDGKVEKARKMLEDYLSLIKNDRHSPPTEEMENIETLSGLVQLDMDSLERMFETYERQLQQELEEPTSISL